jgi:hypothetical protein
MYRQVDRNFREARKYQTPQEIAMMDWWDNITRMNQMFYSAAAFFSVFFLWQLIATFMGLGGDDADADIDTDIDGDLDADAAYDEFEDGADNDAMESVTAFKLLSLRTIITFFTLFTWATALSLHEGMRFVGAMGVGIIWGVVGMFLVAWMFYMLKKLSETGNKKIASCVGTTGSVYLDIPENGRGEVKVTVSDVVTHVKARGVDGKAISANTPIKVLRVVDQNVVEVDKLEEQTKE